MTDNCEKFLENVLTPEQLLKAETALHLKQCSSCAILRADVMSLAPSEPSENLNAKIFATKPVRHNIWRWVSVATAASFFVAVAIGILVNHQINEPQLQNSTEKIEVATVSFNLSDLEEASYELDFDLSSCSYALNEL